MGNSESNACEEIGWKDQEIGSKELLELWVKYDVNNSGTLDLKEATKFLKEFGATIGKPLSKEEARTLYYAHGGGLNGLSQENFLSMFVAVVPEQISLTSSLQIRKEQHEAAEQEAIDMKALALQETVRPVKYAAKK